MARSATKGAPYKYVALPGAASAIPMNDTEMMMLHYHLDGVASEQWPERLSKDLRSLGRVLAKEGQAVTDPQAQTLMLEDLTDRFKSSKLKLIEALGGCS
jgi:hypothetical protein